ncbi:MAG: hypothetical protein A2X11_05955 [Bacteroidetes bacterium GWE2_42_24]|nr:MAG: hypothetical protein A2X11_05955 [Bacteroidetes bacterium GWE2_42_24]HCT85922.1 hypothetical protein [Candidatus Margulisiibacteriota bacterium]
MKNIKNWINKYSIELSIIILGFTAIHLFLLFPTYRGETIEAAKAGLFGDFIGGYLGTTFALISVVLLFRTLKAQKEVFTKEEFKSQFFDMLKLHRDNVSEIGLAKASGRKVFVLLLREFRALLKITNEICTNKNAKLSKEQKIDITYLSLFFGVGPNSTRVLRNALAHYPDDIVNSLIKAIEDKHIKDMKKEEELLDFKIFEGHQSRLGHYFRHLYQTVTYVHEQKIDIPKYDYVKILRAQLSTHEQALLFINSISSIGNRWKKEGLIKDYKLIKNIPHNFFDIDREIDIKEVYPDVIFEWEENINIEHK